ncbi:MAG: aminotransferase class V-fold PLP-dependent enzyme [Thermoanaerobaculia bacterium]
MLTVDPLFTELRRSEYSRLDAEGEAYLDFTGSGLYANRQIDAHADRLKRFVFGNPHSENGPSLLSTDAIDRARQAVLDFLDASPDDYVVCFTANTSAAIKLVAESYPFGRSGGLVLTADNHNSMNGVREFARARGARVDYVHLDDDLRLAEPREALSNCAASGGGLFGYPAQSNFTGVRHSLDLIEDAHALGLDVLIDAAAYLPTSRFSLSRHPADFLVFSGYKILGYPTGVGALVARRDKLEMLKRPWFAGGTVEYASIQHGTHLLRDAAEGAFEDGTPAFLSIAALVDGFEMLCGIGMERIQRHVAHLTAYTLEQLSMLRRDDGGSLVKIYGPEGMADRGGTIAFNVLRYDDSSIPFAEVETRARDAGVSLRGGCFCNPGAAEAAFGFLEMDTERCFAEEGAFSIEKFSRCLGPGVAVGAVRASIGIPTNLRDIERALDVVRSFG